ncbi:MAG: disulfide bond formation protein B [Pseudomonadota bacterium]
MLVERLLSRTVWPIAAALASLAMLGAAHAFERFAFLAPCPLCLRQREVYWAVIAMVVTGLILAQLRTTPRFLNALNALIGLAFFAGAMVAGYHAGVEWGLLPAPAGCEGGGAVDLLSDDLGLGERIATESCKDAPWHFLGLSMAVWNALISLGLAALSVMAELPNRKAPSPIPE